MRMAVILLAKVKTKFNKSLGQPILGITKEVVPCYHFSKANTRVPESERSKNEAKRKEVVNGSA